MRNKEAQSGLSGASDNQGPPRQGPQDFRGRLREVREATLDTFQALPRVLRLVWDVSPGLTVGLAVATVLSGFVPAATAYTAKLLINTVVQSIVAHAHHEPDQGTLTIPLPLVTVRSP